MNSVGSSLMMLESRRPFASAGEPGMTTCRPGTWANQVCRLLVCCGPWPQPFPMIALIVTGIFARPPDMKRHGAIQLTIWSIE